MSVIYFTNNAGSGAGSLVEAIKNASPGDVVRPDESVFERGSTIEIVLAETLTLDKNLTLDGGPFRVRLSADGKPRCVALAESASVEMTAFDVVGGGWNSQTNADVGNAAGAGLYVPGGASIALNRCGFFACRGTYGGAIAVGTGAAATLNNCVVAGCYARGSGAGIRSVGNASVYSSTIIGNVEVSPGTSGDILVEGSGAGRVTLVNSIVGKYRGNVEIGDGCVVGVASPQIGFVAPPPDDLSAETWNANAGEIGTCAFLTTRRRTRRPTAIPATSTPRQHTTTKGTSEDAKQTASRRAVRVRMKQFRLIYFGLEYRFLRRAISKLPDTTLRRDARRLVGLQTLQTQRVITYNNRRTTARGRR